MMLILHGLAIIGIAHLGTELWSATESANARRWAPALSSERVERDIYPDTDYSLRPAIEPWDISHSYPYPRRFAKNVTEGTWLRITTHPSQDEIVFDMLGTLYCMTTRSLKRSTSLSPTLAHPFLTGIPFDKEAEFSPDGSSLVFISDAGFGVDNIWTVPYTDCEEMARRAVEEVRNSVTQQTNSTFRFFSVPSFHPQ